MKTVYFYLSILFITGLVITGLVSCDGDEEKQDPVEVLVSGTVIESGSGELVEGVTITGFDGGVYTNNSGTQYGTPVPLGVTNTCGEFQIELPENIRGVGAHGNYDTTVAMVRFTRNDVGEVTTSISYSAKTADISIAYAPILKPFFKELYVVRSADLQSVAIGWNVYSLREIYTCPPPFGGPCANDSDGFLHIDRPDISDGVPYMIPIEIDTDQTFVDTNLPAGDFTYWLSPGDSRITSYWADVTNSTDTVFLVKPYSSPVFNHCD